MMATLKQYFDTDFSYILSMHNTYRYTSEQESVEIIGRVHLDGYSNTKYISYFVPICNNILPLCASLISDLHWVEELDKGVLINGGGFLGEKPISLNGLPFSGRIFIYSEVDLAASDLDKLIEAAQQLNISLRFRGPRYAQERSRLEKPLAFICHDSRDKDEVSRPLASLLQQMLCPVWYDEFSLNVGDSLRGSIEKGLKDCSKCIIILSPNFLSNNGWTKVEFGSVFTRQILERKNIVLPVWHGVSPLDVYNYSPSLADKVGLNWSLGKEKVAQRLYRAITADTNEE